MKTARITTLRDWVFVICLFFTIALLVAGFFVPPRGVIDGSVLTAAGILFAFATLAQVPSMVRHRAVELRHGKTSLTLGDDDPGENGLPQPDNKHHIDL